MNIKSVHRTFSRKKKKVSLRGRAKETRDSEQVEKTRKDQKLVKAYGLLMTDLYLTLSLYTQSNLAENFWFS